MTNAVYLASLVNSTGYNVTLSGATVSSGTGVAFPATQSASSDANTLDDYEEGTWTPAYGAQGGTPSVTYGTRTGRYVKTGQTVNVWLYISISAFSGGTGYLTVTGLPFTNGDVQGGLNSNWSNAAWTTVFPSAGHIGSSTSFAYMVYYNGASTSQIQFSNLANGCELTMFGSYKASA